MSRLWWTAVAVFLTAQSIDAVNEITLAEVMDQVWNLYNPTYTPPGRPPVYPMFSLALSIPYNEQTKRYDLGLVTNEDKPEVVRAAMINCQVYIGSRVVGATVLSQFNSVQQCPQERVPWDFVRNRCPNVKVWADFSKCPQIEIETLKSRGNRLADHAEYRVHQNFNTVFSQLNRNSLKKDLMLFYVYKNPCIGRCMNEESWFSIITTIQSITYWTNLAFVFTHPFMPHDVTQAPSVIEQNNHDSVKALGDTLGLKNVYRCVPQKCISCYAKGATDEINTRCLKD